MARDDETIAEEPAARVDWLADAVEGVCTEEAGFCEALDAELIVDAAF